jgi:hypothetical protein
VRLVPPAYVMSNSVTGGYTERFVEAKKEKKGGMFRSKDKGSEGLGPKPDGVRGRWWHEGVRAQAAVPGLNFVAIRAGEIYGEAFGEGQVLARLVIGEFRYYVLPACFVPLS